MALISTDGFRFGDFIAPWGASPLTEGHRQEPGGPGVWPQGPSSFSLWAPMEGVCAQGRMWLPSALLAQFLPLTGDSLPSRGSRGLGEQSQVTDRAWQSALRSEATSQGGHEDAVQCRDGRE